MSLAIIYSRAQVGIDAPLVTVETHITPGMPRFNIVGLAETTVKESKDRVRSALINSHFEFPCKRITVNLAPADLPKESGRYDLAIAMGILIASKQLPNINISEYEFIGELGLSGELRKIRGALNAAIATEKTNRTLILPEYNAQQASLIEGATILAAKHLLDIFSHFTERQVLVPVISSAELNSCTYQQDMAEVKGQTFAKNAMEIAAAGGHSILMVGPPGSGKSMLASRLNSIMPNMTITEALESAAIYGLSHNDFQVQQWRQRPFRQPHHTASSTALVGGGSIPCPGEISLAHRGILFLDELPEFKRDVLESLREPLEKGTIEISRAARHASFPAQFQLIAAMNPCPCGYYTHPNIDCNCSTTDINRYLNKLSGPLLDRIDLQIQMPPVDSQYLLNLTNEQCETSADITKRVIAAREIQYNRCNQLNSQLTGDQLEQYCALSTKQKLFLQNALEKLNLSARCYHRILRISRTIADLAKQQHIEQIHLSKALSLRKFEQIKNQR